MKKAGTSKRRHARWRKVAGLVTVLGLVAAAVGILLMVLEATRDEDTDSTLALLADIAGGIDAYKEANGKLPERIAQIVGPQSPYTGSHIPEDRWRTRIQYRPLPETPGGYVLRSLGPDKQAGTDDDLLWPVGAAWPE